MKKLLVLVCALLILAITLCSCDSMFEDIPGGEIVDDNTGDDNTGDDNTGDDNTGDDNTGDDNTGDDNTGDDNTGDDNTGDDNTGDDNTGDDNTGDDNTGDDNTGDDNTGDDNTGDDNDDDATDFSEAEKQLFLDTVGFVIPFINGEYVVEEFAYDYDDGDCAAGINFYVYDKTQAEFNAYLELLDAVYEFAYEEADEYGDVWYYYDYEGVYIDVVYYELEDGYVVDVYVYVIESDEGGSGDDNTGDDNTGDDNTGDDNTGDDNDDDATDFTAEEKQLFLDTFGFVIPFIDGDYYIEAYSGDYGNGNELGINFYCYDITKAQFDEYLALFKSLYVSDGQSADEYGDTWYYFTYGDAYLDISYYDTDYGYLIDVYVYVIESDEGGSGDDNTGDDDETDGGILAAISGKVGQSYYVEGTVVAINAQGFIIKDSEAMVYVYRGYNWSINLSVGDKVSVSGITSSYGGAVQFDKSASYQKLESGSYNQPSPVELTPAQLDAYSSKSNITPLYITLTARLNISSDSKYYNLTISGASIIGSISYPTSADASALKALNGKDIVLNGYITGSTSGGKYLTIIVTDFASASSGSGSGGGSTDTSDGFTGEEKALFLDTVGFVLPFIGGEYYVEEYTFDHDDGDTEIGINFYVYGKTSSEFNGYLNKLKSLYVSAGQATDEYGDIWYYFDNGDIFIDVCYYEAEDGYVIDVYAYYYESSGSGSGSGSDSGSGSGSGSGSDDFDYELITNYGAGLPSAADGVYEIVITDALTVPNVTAQSYYLDGCPTTGSPKVLVIPVEFSDVTAASKGYEISNIVKAFNGGDGDTDYYSVHDYYYISSYGQLDLDITVVGEWFRPQYTSTYYARQTADYYGETIEIGDQMIIDEALAYLDGKMDLSEFDSDNNTCIDAVVIINTLTIDHDEFFYWAYRYWNMYTDEEDYYYEYDGVSANDYLWASYQFLYETTNAWGETSFDDENAMNTYTFIHEFGHVLGADDYYDTSGVTDGPLSGYDVMDAMSGDHNPYSKLNFGWITEARLIVSDSAITLDLKDFSETGDIIILATNWDPDLGVYQEYFIVCYYTIDGLNAGQGGYFDKEGILVYHVNASLYVESEGGEDYYLVYNTNTDPVGDPDYGTEDNLIEFVTAKNGNLMFFEGDSLPTVYDDNGTKLGYTFKVDSLGQDSATLTFTPVK